jgi:CheY-like chemotaxis protein
VVLLDINMPRMTGLELLDILRGDGQLRDTVVFMLTTSDDERDLARAYANQIAGYVVKSDAGADFLNLVSMLEQFSLTVRFPAIHPTETEAVRNPESLQ